MGVPSLYKWLTQRYPEIKLKLSNNEENLTDNLYLDFNAIIHPCCNKTLDNMLDTDRELYNNLEVFLDDILAKVRPKRLLYISIDGVAPRAKLNQQRARRFTHAKEIIEEGKAYFKDDCGSQPVHHLKGIENNLESDKTDEVPRVFDTNAITPGTEFMVRLDIFLQELISYKLSVDERWKNINVIYSGFRIPGEGEQKILEYIRKHQSPVQSCIILSPDADLIFLGLTLFDYNVKILREEHNPSSNMQKRQKDFSLIDIPKLKNLLIKEFKSQIKVPFDHKRFLEDWVLLCFTVGNDFLPCSPCFEIRTNALDKLSYILQSVFLKTRSFITDHGKINFHVLREFFIECARREDDFLVEKRNNLIQTRNRMNIPFNQGEEFYLDNERGKIRFYVEKMGINSEVELIEACKEYIKGFVWVYNYYFYDIPCWDWYYPFHFAPFMSDLGLVKDFSPVFHNGKPLKPLEQLLTVLPPLSKELLPEGLHSIFTEFKKYYPDDFKLDMFQKCMDWQAVAIIPFMNTKDIVKIFEEKQHLLSFEESERNVSGYPIHFSRQLKVISRVYPMYTEMKINETIKLPEYTGKIFPLEKFRALEEEIDSYGFKYVNRVVKFSFDQRKTLSKKN